MQEDCKQYGRIRLQAIDTSLLGPSPVRAWLQHIEVQACQQQMTAARAALLANPTAMAHGPQLKVCRESSKKKMLPYPAFTPLF